jgi:hypothetical protein
MIILVLILIGLAVVFYNEYYWPAGSFKLYLVWDLKKRETLIYSPNCEIVILRDLGEHLYLVKHLNEKQCI